VLLALAACASMNRKQCLNADALEARIAQAERP
jgi:hypothetical protein